MTTEPSTPSSLRGECEDTLIPSIPVEMVGISYHTASLQVRGPMGFAGAGLDRILHRFTAEGFEECLLLSTCNRTEAYFVGGCREEAERLLSEESNVPFEELRPYLYAKSGSCAAMHLFTVASGLDSAVLGETEILAQIKSAVATARHHRCIGRHLDFLIRRSQGTSRRVRTETELCRNVTSVGSLAVRDAASRTGGLSGKRVLLLGAGKIAERVAKDLVAAGVAEIHFVNRTYANAVGLAHRYGGQATPFSDLESTLATVDVAFTAATSDLPLIDAATVQRLSAARAGSPLTIVDLGVPSNVHTSAATSPNLDVLDMDDLVRRCSENSARRQACVPAATEIVLFELGEYTSECFRRAASPVIEALVRFGEDVKTHNLSWANEKLGHLSEQDLKVVADLASRMVKGFLQSPIQEMKEELTGQQQRELITRLFHLDVGGRQDR